jgi:hypothetical protein
VWKRRGNRDGQLAGCGFGAAGGTLGKLQFPAGTESGPRAFVPAVPMAVCGTSERTLTGDADPESDGQPRTRERRCQQIASVGFLSRAPCR